MVVPVPLPQVGGMTEPLAQPDLPRPSHRLQPLEPPPRIQPPPVPSTTHLTPALRAWLVDQREAGATPQHVAAMLDRSGWPPHLSRVVADQLVRPEERHRALWGALCFSTGFAALAVGSLLHLGLGVGASRQALAMWGSIAIVATVVAAVCFTLAVRAEHRHPYCLHDRSRRRWFLTLAWISAGVGLLRGLVYTYLVLAGDAEELLQPLITLVVAGSLVAWSSLVARGRSVALLEGVDERSRERAMNEPPS
jgi:hypothetical protein